MKSEHEVCEVIGVTQHLAKHVANSLKTAQGGPLYHDRKPVLMRGPAEVTTGRCGGSERGMTGESDRQPTASPLFAGRGSRYVRAIWSGWGIAERRSESTLGSTRRLQGLHPQRSFSLGFL
ncbi:hypothetical protein [Aporhodopirellula aestuarii]|uniref:Uncharacterized protein n=1 Tax=Aporhodopirellula aestuarii TaxID=2950107 RepID=A0ABT0U9A2_9BACT|nr:hypothetical protein [Aporhodopirellula aestuarii]MCM2373269.1 hypothetical protein [Aporhodopirellula aestuarii]